MIGKLRGLIDSKGEDWVIIDVGGVGYHVTCSARTLGELPGEGGAATLSIETKVSDDAIRLVGFGNDLERDWFRLLLTVQGVGTRVALGVLSTLTPDDLARAIQREDKKAVSAAPGVGPKVATRIVTELKDKAPVSQTFFVTQKAGAESAPVAEDDAMRDAVSALVNLGYQPQMAANAIASAAKKLEPDVGAEQLIRQGLKELAR